MDAGSAHPDRRDGRSRAENPIHAGTHQMGMAFDYDGGGLAKGATSRIPSMR